MKKKILKEARGENTYLQRANMRIISNFPSEYFTIVFNIH